MINMATRVSEMVFLTPMGGLNRGMSIRIMLKIYLSLSLERPILSQALDLVLLSPLQTDLTSLV